MNPELQKSLQVTALPSTLDGYMLMILVIMIAAGILGGVANYYLSDRQGEPVRRDWGKYLTLGVIAALTVPLFLNMISSNLLEAARTRPVDFFVFAGFCLIYVVASRRVFENVANRLFGQMAQMKSEMVQIKEQRQEAPPPAPREEPAPAVEVPAQPVVQPKPEVVRESLSYNDIEILRALAEECYVYGNLVGLTDKTGLARDLVSTRLTVLKNLGIIETRINDKNVLHWYVSPKGKQMLGDILSGQDDR
ncbi:MAG: YEATS-associated helix-containing protein [Betaproteobacteria bacterium]